MSKAYELATVLGGGTLVTDTDLSTAIAGVGGGENTPYFRVDLRNNQSIPNATMTSLQFDNAALDSASGWDGTTYKYTIPETGKWFISHMGRVSGGGNNTIGAGDINCYLNSDQDLLAHVGLTPNTGSPMGIYSGTASGIYDLTQGDEIYCKVYVSAGSARIDGRSDGSFTAMSGFKLAE